MNEDVPEDAVGVTVHENEPEPEAIAKLVLTPGPAPWQLVSEETPVMLPVVPVAPVTLTLTL